MASNLTITNLMEKFKDSTEESDKILIASQLKIHIKSIRKLTTKKSQLNINLKELREKFTEYCTDFAKPLEESSNSTALEFSNAVLFRIGPKSRRDKSKMNITAKFKFDREEIDTDGPVNVTKTVVVTTLRKAIYNDLIKKDVLVLSLEDASLLALTTYMNLIDVRFISKGQHIMTRLCSAIYKKDSIPKAAELLKKDECTVSKIMNSSTIRCGYHLEYSDMACALIAAFESMHNLDAPIKEELLRNCVINYMSLGKKFKQKRLLVFAECALGFQKWKITKSLSGFSTLRIENDSKVEPN